MKKWIARAWLFTLAISILFFICKTVPLLGAAFGIATFLVAVFFGIGWITAWAFDHA
jgi:hypothetical protein